ncbi:MAG TPA: HAD family hydrolase [Deltaproteobacteria bacterium]|nr:HAD family hydrolase [Deltaproteobacteria bacterium]HDZ89049.1 HAD family hydrolase [Deltaproteobacteria bacterium]
MPRIGVLFDFDGTLTLPGALDFPAIKEALGCPRDQLILEFVESQPPDRRAMLMEILEQREAEAARASLPNRGAEKCLLTLKERGIPVGILTRNSLRSVKEALNRFTKIALDDFAAVVTRDTSLPKPHPEGVRRVADQMGLLPSQLLMVGDFRFDIIAGKRAGAITVLLTNGGGSVMIQGDPEPDYTIRHLEELPGLLSRLGVSGLDRGGPLVSACPVS